VPEVRSLLSPEIVGRDDLLRLAERRLDEVKAGKGQFLLLSGEAGIGKTRLLGAIRQLAAERAFGVATADLLPQDRDVLAASFLDLGRAMRRSSAYESIGRSILKMLESRLNAQVARRRDLVMEVADLLAGIGQPTMLVFEDLQWADDLTLEILTELARHSREQPLLLIGAYRSNEVLGGSVLREWRSRLVTQRIAEEVRLDRLSRDETALMTSLILGTGLPAPRDVVDAVHARTNGVPLHVEELCRAIGRERLSDSRAVLDAAVPETLEDAILSRANGLSREARAVAEAGSVMGRCFMPRTLAGVMNRRVEELDDPLDELVAAGFLYPYELVDQGYFDFRHQLLRDALYRSVPAGDRRRFHARAGEFEAELDGHSEIHASLHYERAGLTEKAFETALAAARQAREMSSHREAFDLFRRAVDNMPASLSADEKVGILLQYADAASNIDRTVLASDLAGRARELAHRTGNRLGAIEGLVIIADVARREGESVVKRRDLSRQLLNEIEATPASPNRDVFLVFGLHALALVEQDDSHFSESRTLLEEAREVAEQIAKAPPAVTPLYLPGFPNAFVAWIDEYLAQLDVIGGQVARGLETIRANGAAARSVGAEDVGVGCYRDETLLAMRMLDFRRASAGLAEGLRYAESVEQSYCGHWLASAEAVLSWAEGRWDEAMRQGGQALSDPGSAGSHAMAQWALGYVAAGRGRRAEAEQHLLPALEFARRAERIDMLLPAQWGLAQSMLCSGAAKEAAALCDEALRVARERGEWALLGPFAVTGARAYQAAGQPEAAARYLDQLERAVAAIAPVLEPAIRHARGLVQLAEGSIVLARESFEAALRGWDARGRGWESLWARLDLAGALLRSRRFGEAITLIDDIRREAEVLRSVPLLERADQLSRQARGHSTQVEAWHPLTSREFEVARAIAEGMTNAEVADELGISPKTASAHVEHILAKLGATRRAEIAAWATSVMATSGQAREAAAVR
jgi:DNA-binding CsgD family transcriptional regulator